MRVGEVIAEIMKRERIGVLGEYLDGVRDVERRVAVLDQCAGTVTEGTQADAAHRFVERMALMSDMVALVFRADLTRVASGMMVRSSMARSSCTAAT